MPTYAYQSPTSHTEPSGDWHNPARVYDGNWNNFADCEAHYFDPLTGAYPTNYLILNLASTIIVDRIRFKKKYTGYVGAPINIDIFNMETGKWDVVLNESSNNFAEEAQIEIGIANTKSNKVRFRHCLSGVEIDLYELDVRRVIPDDPNVPVPNDQEVVITKMKVDDRAEPLLGLTRVRTVHRSSAIKPWVVK